MAGFSYSRGRELCVFVLALYLVRVRVDGFLHILSSIGYALANVVAGAFGAVAS
jgi:hypothetical protein